MTRDLFKLFDTVGISHDRLVASEAQSLSDMATDETEQDLIIRRSERLLETELKVDYNDFANHVWFNSALDYFNISGEKILNKYPSAGTRADLENFVDDLDGYQRHVLNSWPTRLGHLNFRPAVSSSYVQIDDVGQENGVTKTSLLSPGTGSISVEAWYNSARPLTGSEEASFLVHKEATAGYSVYLSGSTVHFRVMSGSSNVTVSAPASINSDGYVMGVLDRSTTSGTLLIYTGSLTRFPVLVSSASVTFGGHLYGAASASLFIGSGSVTGKTTIFYSGTVDDVRIWRVPLSLEHMSSSYNRKNFAQSSLVGLWRFNETGSTGITGLDSMVADYSGHGINGRIRNYWSGARGSGSMFYETPDPMMDIRNPEVLTYVTLQQASGSEYDRNNTAKITDLVPAAYLEVSNDQDSDLVRNFLNILGRHYDRLKLYAQHLAYTLRVNYSEYDQVPDSKLEDMAKFFGWELPGGFANSTAMQYMMGRDVQLGELSNEELDQKLYEIKVQFWRRTMNNLAHIYKTKGTRESVESLMHVYGVNDNFVRLKEYGYTNRNSIETQRMKAEKSSYALWSNTSSLYGSVMHSPVGQLVPLANYTVETRLRWPTTASVVMAATTLSGSVWRLTMGGEESLRWERNALSSNTGSLILILPQTALTMSGLPIFNDKWYHTSVVKNVTSGTYIIGVRQEDNGVLVYSTSSVYFSSSIAGFVTDPVNASKISVGQSGTLATQQWQDEFRLWNSPLLPTELDDHTLNYQSYGRSFASKNRDLCIHWRLNDGVTATAAGVLACTDFSLNTRHGTGSFPSGSFPFKKFLNSYNYIGSPDFGWTENKVRVFDGKTIKAVDRPVDSKLLALEFNMIDQLNEDISQMNDSLDEMNDVIGNGATMYRSSYTGLETMRREYFRRLTGRLNFRVFIDMLDFFDKSFIEVVRKLIPARAVFLGDEIVVESHMLERPKHQYEYRPIREIQNILIGVIRMLKR